MATAAIDETYPDGSILTVSILDDAIKDLKRDIRERMQEGLVDPAIQTWNNTSTKELQEGTARIFTDTIANKAGLTRLHDGKVWVGTNGDNTNAFEYYNGAAWTAVPIGTANLLTNAVTTTKITDLNVTTGKLAAQAVTASQTELTNVTDDTVVGTTLTMIGTTSGTDFTFSITPFSTASVIMFVLQCVPTLAGGANTDQGTIRIQNTTGGGATVISSLTSRQDQIDDAGDVASRHPFVLIGFDTGRSGAQTYQAQMAAGVGGQTIHLNGDDVTARFMAIEFKR